MVPRTTYVSYPGDVVLDIYISRLPYADSYGDYGIGWTEFDFNIYYDYTRFELVPYLEGGRDLVSTDTETWLGVDGWPVGSVDLRMVRGRFGEDLPLGVVGVWTHLPLQNPVMSDTVLSLRFRVLSNALPGNDVEFRWGSADVAGFCPVIHWSGGVFRLPIAGPYLTDFCVVNVTSSGTLIIEHIVTFDANGGTLVDDGTSRLVSDGQTLGENMPADPTRSDGFTFAGWSIDPSDFGAPFYSTTPVVGDIVVFAMWAPLQPVDAAPDLIQEPIDESHQAFVVGLPILFIKGALIVAKAAKYLWQISRMKHSI